MGQARVSRKRGCAEAKNCASAPLELGTSAPLPGPELERRHSGFLCSSECFRCWTNRAIARAFLERPMLCHPQLVCPVLVSETTYMYLASDSSSLLLLPWDFF